MPGSLTTPEDGTRVSAPAYIAFRFSDSVSARIYGYFAAQWLAYALPCRRFVLTLTGNNARLGAGVARYSFTVMDLHHLLLVGLPTH